MLVLSWHAYGAVLVGSTVALLAIRVASCTVVDWSEVEKTGAALFDALTRRGRYSVFVAAEATVDELVGTLLAVRVTAGALEVGVLKVKQRTTGIAREIRLEVLARMTRKTLVGRGAVAC